MQQLIADMEQLFQLTGDINFSLIITDYNSTDMDVRKALEKSSLPRYVSAFCFCPEAGKKKHLYLLLIRLCHSGMSM